MGFVRTSCNPDEASAAKRYGHGQDALVDKALDQHDIQLPADPTWWEIVDLLAGRGLWRIAFRVPRTLARTRPVVLFATRLNSRLTGNLESVHKRMVARGLDKDYRLVIVAKPDIGRPMSWRDRLRRGMDEEGST